MQKVWHRKNLRVAWRLKRFIKHTLLHISNFCRLMQLRKSIYSHNRSFTFTSDKMRVSNQIWWCSNDGTLTGQNGLMWVQTTRRCYELKLMAGSAAPAYNIIATDVQGVFWNCKLNIKFLMFIGEVPTINIRLSRHMCNFVLSVDLPGQLNVSFIISTGHILTGSCANFLQL